MRATLRQREPAIVVERIARLIRRGDRQGKQGATVQRASNIGRRQTKPEIPDLTKASTR
jgi:hypothetical protein